jgi:NPCBM/NEW2 domain
MNLFTHIPRHALRRPFVFKPIEKITTKKLLAEVLYLLFLTSFLLHAENEIERANPNLDANSTQSLINLLPTKTEVGFWQLLAGSHPEKRQVVIEENPRKDYLLAHAPSRVEYDIPVGAAKFSALAVSTSNQSCTFSIAVDGKVMFALKSLGAYNHGVVDINVVLPKEGKKLALITTSVGDFNGCQTC